MDTKNFTDFTLKNPTNTDFLVGYNSAATEEYRTPVIGLSGSYLLRSIYENTSGTGGASLQTVLNYLSTNNVSVSSITIGKELFIRTTALNSASGCIIIGALTTGALLSAGILDGTGNPLDNIFIGNQAGLSTTSATGNVLIGSNAGLSLTSMVGNVFIGTDAGKESAGNLNTYIGSAAGKCNISANSVAIGGGALACAASQNNAVAIGAQAGQLLGCDGVAAAGNILIGYRSGLSSTSTGGQNIYIGNCAGFCSCGTANIYMGNRTGIKTTTGTNNVFIGTNSGAINGNGVCTTTGTHNVFIGSGATGTGRCNSVGGYNTAVGNDAYGRTATGVANTAIGQQSLFSMGIGDFNTAVGASSGPGPVGAVGNYGTYAGYGAGFYYDGTLGPLSGVVALGAYATPNNHYQLAIGSDMIPLSTVADTTITRQTSSLMVNINGSLARIPLLPFP